MRIQKEFRWRTERYPSPTPTMYSSLHAETRRLLKNQFTRYGILALLFLTTVYIFNAERFPKDSSQNGSGGSWASQFGNTGVISTPQLNDEVVDSLKIPPAVGKVHAVFGEPNPVYERALRLHEAHSELAGHPMFVLRERLLSGLWSKPAFILSIMLQELAKPEDQRLQWLL